MKRTAIALAAALLFAALAAAAQKTAVKDLPPRYRAWLEEDVVYIIGPKEKEVFLQLSDDRERDMFIEAFWKARDEDPSTPGNKFKEEHYRRIEYANTWFGRGRKAGGWRSDMGRIYITLGEPKTVEKHENESNLTPMVIWFYSGLTGAGLPDAFNVVFFKKNVAGDFVLYSPVADGPQSLMPFYNGDMTNYLQAWGELRRISAPIADISMSLIPGEYVTGANPSQSSDILINQKIPKYGYGGVKDAYAQKLLKYKDIVEVEYTAHYLESDALVHVTRDGAGRAFVHYLLEPARLSIERTEGLYRTTFNVNGIISDPGGRTVYQFDRTIPVELRPDQFADIKDRPVQFQDAFALIPGDYNMSVLWKNTASKEFTSVEASLKIPPAGTLTLSVPILANRVIRNPAFVGQVKPFTVGDTQIVASPRNDFAARDTLSLYCELGGLTDALMKAGSLVVTITRDGQVVASKTLALGDLPDPLHVIEDFPLAGYSPAYYSVSVALVDAARKELLSSKSAFYVTLGQALPRPWILYASMPPAADPSYTDVLGMQNFRIGNLAAARALLEEASRRSPETAAYALDYCRILYAVKDYVGIQRVAMPFYSGKNDAEFARFLGESAEALGRYAAAIGFYGDYLTSFGTNLDVLNSIGDCYVKVGDFKSALTAWRRSLELNPAQEPLRKKVAEAEGKIKGA